MAENQTLIIDIANPPLVEGEWVDISGGNTTGLVTNRSDTTVLFQLSDVKPATGSEVGHRMEPGENTTFSVPANVTFFARPLTNSGPVRLAVTYGVSLAGVPLANSSVRGINADINGRALLNTGFGEVKNAMQFDDVSINFQYGLSTRQLKTALSTGTGSVSLVGSDAQIECGAGIGKGFLESLDSVRYRPGHDVICNFTHDQTELQAGVDVKHGLFDSEDGIAIGSQGEQFGCWFMEDSNTTFIPSSTGAPIDAEDNFTQFNIDPLDGTGPSGFNLDPTKRNLFGISFGYLSISPIYLMVLAGKDSWVPFHVFDFVNKQALGHIKNPNLPVSCSVERVSGSGTSVAVKSGSWRAGVAGGDRIEIGADRWFDFEATRVNLPAVDIVTNPNLYQNMFSMHNKSTFAGKPNHIRLEVAVAVFATDGNKFVEFVGVVNGTLSGNTAFADRDTLNSVVEISTGGTVDGVAAGARTILGKIENTRADVRGTGIFIRPGQTFTIAARGFNGDAFTGDVAVSFRWVEEF